MHVSLWEKHQFTGGTLSFGLNIGFQTLFEIEAFTIESCTNSSMQTNRENHPIRGPPLDWQQSAVCTGIYGRIRNDRVHPVDCCMAVHFILQICTSNMVCTPRGTLVTLW